MQIRKLQVKNFKSLFHFQIDLNQFTCFIGLNGSGKSTILQFFDFLIQQMHGNMTEWLAERGWQRTELSFKEFTMPSISDEEIVSTITQTVKQFTDVHQSSQTKQPPITETPIPHQYIDFSIEVWDNEERYDWRGLFDTIDLRCTKERISTPRFFFEADQERFSIEPHPPSAKEAVLSSFEAISNSLITFSYEGSTLSQIKPELLPDEIKKFIKFIKNIHPLGLLSAESLHKPSHEDRDSAGLAGRYLSSFLDRLGIEAQKKLTEQLRDVYPNFLSLQTKEIHSGHKIFEIHEKFGQKDLITEARHINDGMLRLIAILAEIQSNASFLLLDEIENGINPELIEFLLNTLLKASQQIVVTTHSPLILNYLEDETARKSVMYVYKTQQGYTQAIPFFSIPSLHKKLQIMGPGEAFADTNLTHLFDEVCQEASEG